MCRDYQPGDAGFSQHAAQPPCLLVRPQAAATQTGAGTVTRTIGNDQAVAASEGKQRESDFLCDAAESVEDNDRLPLALVDNVTLATIDPEAISGLGCPVYRAVILRKNYVCHGGAGTPPGRIAFSRPPLQLIV